MHAVCIEKEIANFASQAQPIAEPCQSILPRHRVHAQAKRLASNLMQVIYLAPQLIHTSMYKVYNVLAIILLQVPFMSATDCISSMIEYGMTHTSNRQYVF